MMRAVVAIAFAAVVAGCAADGGGWLPRSFNNPPSDYQAKLDRQFGRQLIDPESRRVDILSTPLGLVCGAVNARNRLGGMTGPEPFFATFDGAGDLTALIIMTPQEAARYGGLLFRRAPGAMEARACGFVQ